VGESVKSILIQIEHEDDKFYIRLDVSSFINCPHESQNLTCCPKASFTKSGLASAGSFACSRPIESGQITARGDVIGETPWLDQAEEATRAEAAACARRGSSDAAAPSYVAWQGRRLKSTKTAWRQLRADADLDERVTP
jgi:hypothetical protein